MPGTTSSPVYNARILEMLIATPRPLRGFCSLITALLLLPVAGAGADNWSGSEEELAAKIAAATGPEVMTVEFVNRSSLSRTDVQEIRRGILMQLSARGVRPVNTEPAAAMVRISLSEDLRSYVWVAEIGQGSNESVVVVSQPRPEIQVPEGEAAALAVHKTLLWSQEDRILDVAVVDGDPARMLVLDVNAVTVYRLQNSGWQAEQSLRVGHSRPWPRDLRGRLVLRKDHLFDVYLPGIYCRTGAGAPLTMDCYESDDPWPLGNDGFSLNASYAALRNFFTGVLTSGAGKQTTMPAFYAAAALPQEKYTLWLFDGVDGQLHMLDGVTDQTVGRVGWGSDIASVRSGCRSGWQILATGEGDGVRDTLRPFEILDREPTAVSQAMEVPGTITALWTDSSGASAIAVVRDSEAKGYAAFRITITCGR